MEPVLALVAANVELGFIVRLFAQAVKFFRFPGMSALGANELSHPFRHRLRDSDAFAVVPVVTQVASDIKPVSKITDV